MTSSDQVSKALQAGVDGVAELTPQQRIGVDRVRAVLADDTVWSEPPAGLFEQIAQQVHQEPQPAPTLVANPPDPALQTTAARPFPVPLPTAVVEEEPDADVVPFWRSTKKRLAAMIAVAALVGILCGTAVGISPASSGDVILTGTVADP